MTVAAPALTAADALETIASALDLSQIRRKLADPEEGRGYDRSHLGLLEREYRRFLALKLANPDEDIVPCQIVDEMWHQHILDTMAYADDCERIFGRFMHHFPYFGMRGPEDAQALVDAYDRTLELYRVAFGEPADDTWVSADSSRCRTQCKPMKCR